MSTFHTLLTSDLQLYACIMPVWEPCDRIDTHMYGFRIYVIPFWSFWIDHVSILVHQAPAVDHLLFWFFTDQVPGRMISLYAFRLPFFQRLGNIFCQIRKASGVIDRTDVDVSLCPLLRKNYVCTCVLCLDPVHQDMDMGPSTFSNLQAVYVLQFFSELPVSFPYLFDQVRHILLHLFPCGAVPFSVCDRHPVIILSEIPLDQSSQVPLSFPLVLPFDIFRRSLLSLLPFLSSGSIPSCVFLLYLYGFSTVP